MPVDLAPQYSPENHLYVHYGSPVISSSNVVFAPVKIGAYDGFRVEARDGATGALRYMIASDFRSNTGSSWFPSYGPALSGDTLYMPASGGSLLVRDQASTAAKPLRRVVFFGADPFTQERANYDANVRISTPLTPSPKGDVWFGFRTYGLSEDFTPIGSANLRSGIARVDALGKGVWKSVSAITGDSSAARIPLQCAPALSFDGKTVYFAVLRYGGGGYLVGIDAVTLATKYMTRLVDPYGGDAILSGQSSATPLVGPDGDIYFGVLSNQQWASKRGFLLHFDAQLQSRKLAGAFGWDSTPSVLPTSTVPGWKGSAKYLLVSKYNNYAGWANGDGVNQMALLDPNSPNPNRSIGTMNEVLAVAGPTPDPENNGPDFPNAVYEWCVNSAAVDPATQSTLINSEDGRLYRWDFLKGEITEGVSLEGPIGQAYTPTLVGPTGISYAINNGKLFAVGR